MGRLRIARTHSREKFEQTQTYTRYHPIETIGVSAKNSNSKHGSRYQSVTGTMGRGDKVPVHYYGLTFIILSVTVNTI